jgi:hypothetical protein
LVVFLMIIALPVLFSLLPAYRPVQSTISILLLSQAVISVCFGYSTLATARKRQMEVARNGMIAVVIVAGTSLFVASQKLDFALVAASVFIGSCFYTLLQMRLGASLLETPRLQARPWIKELPLGSVASVLCFFAGSWRGHTTLGGLLGLAAFLILSREKMGLLWRFSRQRVGLS